MRVDAAAPVGTLRAFENRSNFAVFEDGIGLRVTGHFCFAFSRPHGRNLADLISLELFIDSMSHTVISVENLSKRYLLGHKSGAPRPGDTFRDVITREAR